jgi:MFS family permease
MKKPILTFIIIFLGGMFVLYQFLLQGSTSLMVPQLMEDLCINLTQIGFLSAAFFYPYVLLQIPAGILADKYGARNVLIASTLLLVLGTLWFALSGSLLTAFSSRIFMGVASAPGVACAMCLGAKWYPKKFALVAGMFEMMGMIGGALGDYLLSESLTRFSAAYTMGFCAAAGFVLLILIIIFVKNGPSASKENYPIESKKLEIVYMAHLCSVLLVLLLRCGPYHIWKLFILGNQPGLHMLLRWFLLARQLGQLVVVTSLPK